MKLSNFKLVEKKDTGAISGSCSYKATVDVKTGFLFWKKIESKAICKTRHDVFWHFGDTGKYTPGFEVKNLVRVWNANNEQQIN